MYGINIYKHIYCNRSVNFLNLRDKERERANYAFGNNVILPCFSFMDKILFVYP